jgi:hypothetical protein
MQAAQTFLSTNALSTFGMDELRALQERNVSPLAETYVKRYGNGTSNLHLLRAAVADFLFNYKMSQQYPREFTAYDLQHSAQELNAVFNPLIVAFNQDVAVFTTHLSTKLADPSKLDDLGGLFSAWHGHAQFVSDGLLTVRGISGVESLVDTLTQNFFDATQAPALSDVLTAIKSAQTSTPELLKAFPQSEAAVAALGALSAAKPTQAKIGRQLTIDVTPHSLPGASSAELDVKLTSQEDAPPSRFQSGSDSSSEDTLSRVARHNVQTKVRVESLKLFDISSFSALVQRPRGKFPLVPPFVEVPFLGSVLALPLPPAKEYHRSTAIVSAVIVPTAADLAYGIDFTGDRVVVPEASAPHGFAFRKAASLDESNAPIRAFHKAMVNCFATGDSLAYPGALTFGIGASAPAAPNCNQLTFLNIAPEY